MGEKSDSSKEKKNLPSLARPDSPFGAPSLAQGRLKPRVSPHFSEWRLESPRAKRLGEAVEAAFLAKATMLGFPVLKPWGDSRPYDFAVECGRRLWKVQVKCATSHRGTRCSARAAGSGEIYTLEDIDFLVAYVIPINLWYVVPADAFVPRVTVHFNYGPNTQSDFEIYRETWCLLTCSGRARGQGDIPKRCRCEEIAQRCVVCPKR
jgi:hypothetical protein